MVSFNGINADLYEINPFKTQNQNNLDGSTALHGCFVSAGREGMWFDPSNQPVEISLDKILGWSLS